MKTPLSILIPDGESEFALFVAHCLAPYPNIRLHVLSGERWAPLRFSRYCRTYTLRPPTPGDASQLNVVAEIVKKQRVDVLLPTSSAWIAFAIANRQQLSEFVALPPLPEADAFQIANDKWLLAQFLQNHQIPCPPTFLVDYSDTFATQVQGMTFPVLLKPATAWGGEGIRRFDSLSDLKQYLSGQNPEEIRGRFIVQSLLSGFVVGVNVLSQQGELLATTMQRGIIPNTHKYAAAGAIQFIKDETFSTIVQKLVTALNWSGFANVDTLYDDQARQLTILEINARFWGSLRGSLVAGVSFPYLACLAALNIPFPTPDYDAAARYFHPKTTLRTLITRHSETRMTFHESGLKFLVSDPLAEIMRALRQEASDAEPAAVKDPA